MDPFATLGIAHSYDVDLGLVEKTHRELSRAVPRRQDALRHHEHRNATAPCMGADSIDLVTPSSPGHS